MLTTVVSIAIAVALVVIGAVGLAVILVNVRRGNEATARFAEAIRAGAVARTAPGPDGSFALRFSAPRSLGLWVDVELDGHGEDGRDRARVTLAVRADGVDRPAETIRIGEDVSSPLAGATAIGNQTRSVGRAVRFSALIRLVELPEGRIEIRGSVTPAADVTIRRFELMASPWAK